MLKGTKNPISAYTYTNTRIPLFGTFVKTKAFVSKDFLWLLDNVSKISDIKQAIFTPHRKAPVFLPKKQKATRPPGSLWDAKKMQARGPAPFLLYSDYFAVTLAALP